MRSLRGDQGAHRARRAVAGVREPARLLAGALLPRLQLAFDVHALQRQPGAAPARGRAALPPLRPHASACPRTLPAVRRRRPGPDRPGHAARRGDVARGAAAGAHRAGRSRLHRAQGRAQGRARPGARARRSTSSSARRCSPRATTIPHLTLVGVLDADSALFSADFRAAERLFAQLVQVVGPRGPRPARRGEVLIQTDFPTHPLYAAVATPRLRRVSRPRLSRSGALAGFPPYRAPGPAARRIEEGGRGPATSCAPRRPRARHDRAEDRGVRPGARAARAQGRVRARAAAGARRFARATLQPFLRAWRGRAARRAATAACAGRSTSIRRRSEARIGACRPV